MVLIFAKLHPLLQIAPLVTQKVKTFLVSQITLHNLPTSKFD